MAVYNYDTGDVDTTPLPVQTPRDGKYRFRIVKVEDRKTDKGRPQISVRYQCVAGPTQIDQAGEEWNPASFIRDKDTGRMRGFTMFDNIPAPPFAAKDVDPADGESSYGGRFYFARFKEALGQKDNPIFDPQEFVGEEVEIDIQIESYKGRSNPRVKAYNTEGSSWDDGTWVN